MMKVLDFKPTKRTIERLAVREALQLFQLSNGMGDPLPPHLSPEMWQMWEAGLIELQWR